ncbi:MAG: L7Ae/L30e/S12e/Gadd45 family ribosomal protein [Dethiobacteraceae bacterium]|jgi:large subunit ribosomal protein L7A|nr:50S ribosomal protein L7ae-like protein [Bacillota bacterium]
MSLEVLKQAQQVVTGTKQTLKAVNNGQAQVVYVARDAEERVVQPLLSACSAHNVPVVYVASMAELGKACQIKVKAAAAAVLHTD